MRRFHDQKGHRVGFGGLLYAPHAFFSAVVRKLVGHRPVKPWISYRAIRELERLIAPDWRILEFGAGMSTIWLAPRCEHIVSVETDPQWYGAVSATLSRRRLDNVDLRLQEKDAVHILSDIEAHSFDFVLVDGVNRDACMRTALQAVKHGGYIYLDNTDQFVNDPSGHTRIAEDTLSSYLDRTNGSAKYFVDFSPGNFFVSEGLLAAV